MEAEYSAIIAKKEAMEDLLKIADATMDAIGNIAYWYEFHSTRQSDDHDHDRDDLYDEISEISKRFQQASKRCLQEITSAAVAANQESREGNNV